MQLNELKQGGERKQDEYHSFHNITVGAYEPQREGISQAMFSIEDQDCLEIPLAHT